MRLPDGDRLVAAIEAPDGSELAVMSTTGHVLRTACDEFPPRGRDAGGVRAMKLPAGAAVLAAAQTEFGSLAVAVTDEGRLKVTPISENICPASRYRWLADCSIRWPRNLC